MDAAAFEPGAAARPGAGLHRQRLRPEAADAADYHLRGLPVELALRRSVESQLGAAICPETGEAADGRRGLRRAGADVEHSFADRVHDLDARAEWAAGVHSYRAICD